MNRTSINSGILLLLISIKILFSACTKQRSSITSLGRYSSSIHSQEAHTNPSTPQYYAYVEQVPVEAYNTNASMLASTEKVIPKGIPARVIDETKRLATATTEKSSMQMLTMGKNSDFLVSADSLAPTSSEIKTDKRKTHPATTIGTIVSAVTALTLFLGGAGGLGAAVLLPIMLLAGIVLTALGLISIRKSGPKSRYKLLGLGIFNFVFGQLLLLLSILIFSIVVVVLYFLMGA